MTCLEIKLSQLKTVPKHWQTSHQLWPSWPSKWAWAWLPIKASATLTKVLTTKLILVSTIQMFPNNKTWASTWTKTRVSTTTQVRRILTTWAPEDWDLVDSRTQLLHRLLVGVTLEAIWAIPQCLLRTLVKKKFNNFFTTLKLCF